MDQAIGIIGQAVLILVGLAVMAALVVFIFACIRATKRLMHDLRAPNLPYTDAHVPPPFDRPGRWT
jgi:uncharacterized YccA/Bax inhibitor family protein